MSRNYALKLAFNLKINIPTINLIFISGYTIIFLIKAKPKPQKNDI